MANKIVITATYQKINRTPRTITPIITGIRCLLKKLCEYRCGILISWMTIIDWEGEKAKRQESILA